MNNAGTPIRIAIFGDSIAEGLGVEGASYGDLLCAELTAAGRPASLLNLAHTGYQVTDSLRLAEKMVAWDPEIIVVSHGITEALIRPKPKAMRFVPKRWRQKGWLDPRPYFSRKPIKRLYQKLESALRWRWKIVLIKAGGGETWMSQTEYEKSLLRLLEIALGKTSADIILLTPPALDEKFFPGSPQSLRGYQDGLSRARSLLQATKRVSVCDIATDLQQWDDFFDDHFHPNAKGHRKIAAKLSMTIRQKCASLTETIHS